jgi:hypothetical protein
MNRPGFGREQLEGFIIFSNAPSIFILNISPPRGAAKDSGYSNH